MTCPDGSTAPTTETVRFDDVTMTGTRTIFHNDVCGLPPGKIVQPFTLSYKEPLRCPSSNTRSTASRAACGAASKAVSSPDGSIGSRAGHGLGRAEPPAVPLLNGKSST